MAIRHMDDPQARVVELEQRLAEATEMLDRSLTLNDRVDQLIAKISGPAPLAEVRAAMNAVGIQNARQRLEVDTVDMVQHALEELRANQAAERQARDTYAETLTEAKWALAAHFTTRANKTWLALTIDGTPIAEDDQESYDAKRRDEWLDYHAARTRTVADAANALRHAEESTRMAADAVSVAEKRFTGAKHSLDAAAAQLAGLIRCTPREVA